MSDKLIKASEAVDIVAKHSELYSDGEVSTDKGEQILYAIMSEIINLPSSQPEQRWIPVSERLPEDEYVLISKMPSKISGSKWSVAIAIRTADPRSGKIQWRDSGFGIIQDDKVLAWRPLPEAYTEEEA